ncbi:hypothetical protein VEE63_03540 [Escherichia coli]|nr:hypothetical protein VEE63_03540 [Escherichia coli]
MLRLKASPVKTSSRLLKAWRVQTDFTISESDVSSDSLLHKSISDAWEGDTKRKLYERKATESAGACRPRFSP